MRTAPSAGRTNPLEIYTVVAEGLSHYRPAEHALESLGGEDLREALGEAAGDQQRVRSAPLVIVVVAVTARTATTYEERAHRFVALEAGHAVQNILLQAAALGLGAVPVGSFDDTRVSGILRLPAAWEVVYLVPVGHPAST